MDLSIILPTYNEKNNINILIKKILEILNDVENKEIIVVDDNSPDGTYLYCKKEFEKNNQIKLILRQNNRGLANSIGDGIKVSKGKNIIIMDTDLSHDPKLITQIINLNKDYDIVSCSRYCEGGSMGNKFPATALAVFQFSNCWSELDSTCATLVDFVTPNSL